MVISLIGYRGSGKSTVAPVLSARLKWEWADADAVIEQAAGASVREIFAAEGEAGFRRRERETLVSLLARDRLVLAAGGGAVLDAETRRDLRAAGPVVWLRAGVDSLASRIAGDTSTAERRPDLAGGGRAEIAQLLAVREPLYRECASVIVDTDGVPVAGIVERLCRELTV
jgi:shikimate kinase